MKENFEEDKEKKEAKAEPAWYEKRADGTAWFETDFDLEGELSRGGDKTGEENAREKALLKEEERYFDFSKEEADGETEALNETVFPFSEKETTLPEESAFSKEKTENKEKLLAIQEILMHNESHMGFLLLFMCYMGSDGFCPQLCS